MTAKRPVIIFERIPFADPHMNAKVIVLRARWAEVPEAEARQHPTTIMHTIDVSGLVSKRTTIEREKAHVEKTAREYIARFKAVQKALKEL